MPDLSYAVHDVSFPPRGIPLTDSETFDDRDGVQWLVYVEATPADPAGFWQRTTMPGRVTRFDSAAESRVSASRPAGAPFLPARQLQGMLDEAQPVTAAAPSSKPLDMLRTAARLGHLPLP